MLPCEVIVLKTRPRSGLRLSRESRPDMEVVPKLLLFLALFDSQTCSPEPLLDHDIRRVPSIQDLTWPVLRLGKPNLRAMVSA